MEVGPFVCDVWDLPDYILSWNGTWRVLSRAPSLSAGGDCERCGGHESCFGGEVRGDALGTWGDTQVSVTVEQGKVQPAPGSMSSSSSHFGLGADMRRWRTRI